MSYLDWGNPWTTDIECCTECGHNTDDFIMVDMEIVCVDCNSLNI
jgi:DNA-directed RNA polymerase subunit RPC12/RpoP